jgi:hypothetical protein
VLTTLQYIGVIGPFMTQNIDGPHYAALRRVSPEPMFEDLIADSEFRTTGLF